MSIAATNIGLYISAEALAESPDYARRMVEESGISLFVIRTGFDPRKSPARLDRAVVVVAELGVPFQFLVGTWWGAGMEPSGELMRAAATLLDCDRTTAHESQWTMAAPGDANDDAVRERILALCAEYSPAGICLTHARFKHPADINSLFDIAGGPFGEAMAAAGFTARSVASLVGTLEQRLRGLSPECAPGLDVIGFLDRIAESDFFSRWFNFRCRQISVSVASIFGPIRQRHRGVELGTNAMGPLFSRLCGQDYRQLADCCDFIQPLFGYMHWHVLQPIQGWATLLHKKSGTIDPATALELSARLFGFDPGELGLNARQRNVSAEDNEAAITAMVRRQVGALRGFPPARVAPVLRGPGVSARTVQRLVETLQQPGFESILFQGADDDLTWRVPSLARARATPR